MKNDASGWRPVRCQGQAAIGRRRAGHTEYDNPDMSIAYLVSDYHAASHTFVRREVSALRALGIDVLPFSIQPGSQMDGAQNILGRPAHHYLAALLSALFRQPLKLLSCWRLSLRHRVSGIRPLIWSQFHFLEAVLLARLLHRQGVRHLHNHFANSGATVGMLAAGLAGIPWSVTLHGISETDYPAGPLLGEKIERAAFVACASYFMRAQAMRLVDADQWGKMHIVRCGIDLSILPGNKMAPARTDDPVKFISVGRLSPEKGYHGLLTALARLRDQGQDFSLTIVGGGPSSRSIRAAAAALNLMDRIQFTGPLPEDATLAEISNADILILPSLMEGLPVVLIEALALGRPVIASCVAGIPELVEDGQTGWLFPPSDWQQLDHRIGDALDARASWHQMGEAGRDRVKADFRSDVSAARMARLFEAAS